MAGKPTPFDAVHSVLKDRTFEESDADRVAALEGKPKIKKLSNWDTFVAVAKAYCAINVLLLPCSFKNGRYIIAPVALAVACSFHPPRPPPPPPLFAPLHASCCAPCSAAAERGRGDKRADV